MLPESIEHRRFEEAVLPYLDAAYNLARWLTRDNHDAEDVVQEAMCRALKYFASFQGGDGRTWLLKIVRHTCFTWLEKNRPREPRTSFDEAQHGETSSALGPEAVVLQRAENQMLRDAVEALPMEYREAIVLRELEGLSYHQIAEVAGIPLGTVMSRLARGRRQLQKTLAPSHGEED